MSDEYKKTNSRKWRLVLMVLVISTLGTFIPPILSAWVFKDKEILFILTGGNLVALISLVVGAYMGANVLQKKVLKEENNKVDSSEIKIEINEDGEA